ncbi:hypothetical protein LCM4579_17615 [Ensifer sp. LCM 4579]|nr:hypothetical protein LCM4579_17615 [Ensifer sp. LCM 4579]
MPGRFVREAARAPGPAGIFAVTADRPSKPPARAVRLVTSGLVYWNAAPRSSGADAEVSPGVPARAMGNGRGHVPWQDSSTGTGMGERPSANVIPLHSCANSLARRPQFT